RIAGLGLEKARLPARRPWWACLVMAGGALLFIPAADSRAFALFLTALATAGRGHHAAASGGQSYVSILGPARGAAARGERGGRGHASAGRCRRWWAGWCCSAARWPSRPGWRPRRERAAGRRIAAGERSLYRGWLRFWCCWRRCFSVLEHCPTSRVFPKKAAEEARPMAAGRTSALAFPHLVLGIAAIFVYVGVEVGLGSFLIRYGESQGIQQLSAFTRKPGARAERGHQLCAGAVRQGAAAIDTTAGFTKAVGAVLVSSYWFGSLIGRVIGIPLC
ncbi:MAG: hypothetical protein WKG07_29115, partial [Hymenobacter sp.]